MHMYKLPTKNGINEKVPALFTRRLRYFECWWSNFRNGSVVMGEQKHLNEWGGVTVFRDHQRFEPVTLTHLEWTSLVSPCRGKSVWSVLTLATYKVKAVGTKKTFQFVPPKKVSVIYSILSILWYFAPCCCYFWGANAPCWKGALSPASRQITLNSIARRSWLSEREQKTTALQILAVQLEHIMWHHVLSPFK